MSDRKSAWDAYWQTGRLHSSGTRDAQAGYSEVIAGYWRDALGGLPATGRVLNVGCGNGALEQLFAGQGGPVFDGVDLAEIRPDWVHRLPAAERERFRFHSATAVESLPFAEAGFDAVVSQYGIEYAEADRAWPELLRVARPGARLRLLVHHAESLLARTSAEEAAHCQWLRDSELLDVAAQLIPFLAMAPTRAGQKRLAQDAQARSLREQYNTLQAALRQRGESARSPQLLEEFAAGLHQVLGGVASRGREPAEAALQSARLQLEQAGLRYAEILSCALDEAGLAAYLDNLRARGLRVDSQGVLLDQDEALGWKISGEFP